MTVRVRFAPSPTGEPHIGNIRTVVFNWLFVRKMGGKFVLRIEDTDRVRYRPETIAAIMDGLRWLGLDWDEGPDLEELVRSGVPDPGRYAVGGSRGPYIQSERKELYREVAEELVRQGMAYRCNCSPERLDEVRRLQRESKQPVMYDRHCRERADGEVSADEPHVIRLKVPLDGETVVHDLIKGDVVFENAEMDDQVLLKSDGFPTYHLAVVVDDHHMGVTHVIRGDDWIPSTPKRIALYNALGWDIPQYVHVPLVTMPGGKKLAKREGSTSITEFRKQGYLPEALLNFLALLGWSPGDGNEREVFSSSELIDEFELERVSRAPAAFSYDKLDWFNGVYIRSLSPDELRERLIPFWQDAGLVPDPCPDELKSKLSAIVLLIQERLKVLTDVVEWTDFFFRDIDTPSVESLLGKKMTAAESRNVLEQARRFLETFEPFEAKSMEQPMRDLAVDLGLKAGQLFGPIRGAVTGKKVAPPLFGTLVILGREEVLARVDTALRVLQSAL